MWSYGDELEYKYVLSDVITLEWLMQEMKDQFLPCNYVWVTHESLKCLR